MKSFFTGFKYYVINLIRAIYAILCLSFIDILIKMAILWDGFFGNMKPFLFVASTTVEYFRKNRDLVNKVIEAANEGKETE